MKKQVSIVQSSPFSEATQNIDLMEKLVRSYNKEYMRMTMLKHEEKVKSRLRIYIYIY